MRLLKRRVVQSPIEGAHTEMLKATREEEKIRKTGIEIIGDAPWGAHFCQFYQTKEDLIDVLVPYFKAGLESNEFCMWVTSEPLGEEEAKQAMRKAVPNFDRYLERGQIEIVPYTEWYLKDGAFNLQRVLNAWIDKLDQALAKGYDGIRVTGNTAWLEKRDWKSFADYEEKVNDAIGKYRMIAVCTYSLDECGASEVIDVVRNHQFALVRRKGKWEFIESSELKRTKRKMRESVKSFRNALDNMLEGCQIIGYDWRYLYVNDAVAKHGRTTKEKLLGKTMMEMYPGIEKTEMFSTLRRCMKERISAYMENEFEFPDGEKGWFELSIQPVPEGIFILSIDITERRRVEIALRESEKKFRTIFENVNDVITYVDKHGKILDINNRVEEVFGYKRDEIVGKNFTKLGVIGLKNLPKILKLFTGGIRRGKAHQIVELELKHKNGHKVSVDVGTRFIKGNGKVERVVNIIRDVTERKQMETELRKSEEQFRTSIENMLDCFGIYSAIRDQSGRIVDFRVEYVNEAACRNNHMSKEQQIGKRLLELLPAHRETGLFGEYCQVVETGKPLMKESLIYEDIYKKQSLKRAFDIRAVKLGDGFAAAWRDVTERKKAEEKILRASEEWTRTFDAISDLVYILDEDFRIVRVNKATCDFLKKEPEELIGKHCFEVLHGTDEPWPNCPHKRMLAIKKAASEEVNDPNLGLPLLVTASPICDDKGELIRSVHIAKDITKRKKTEERLQLFRNLVDQSNDAIFLIDAKTSRFLDVNYKACTNLGYKRNELLTMKVIEIEAVIPDNFSWKKHVKEVRKKRHMILEGEHKRKDGTRFPVEVSVKLVSYKNHDYMIAVVREITERKMMEEKLKEYAESLEEKVEERTRELKEAHEQLLRSERLAACGELAAMVGHDLRNPLQSIENAAYYLNNELPHLSPSTPVPKKTIEMLKIINDSVNYADKIIRDLHDFSATKKPTLKKTDINAIVIEALSQVEKPENVEVITELGHFPEIKVDKDMIKRIFLNLASNGLQAMENGGRLTIRTKKTKGFIEVSFKDTGIGMPKENMEKIFTPFFTTKAKGMGMGLAICKGFVDVHGGSIEVDSQKGKGSTFTVKLPSQPRQMEVKKLGE